MYFLIRTSEFFKDKTYFTFSGNAKNQTDTGVPVIHMKIMKFLCTRKSLSGVQRVRAKLMTPVLRITNKNWLNVAF